MTTECDELKAQLNRISQEIAALDRKFIPISEKAPIYAAIAKADGTATTALNKAISLATLLAQVAATAASALTTADGASSTAGKALGIANAVAAGLQIVLNELRQYVLRERFTALENRVSIIEKGLDILTRLAGTLANRIAKNASDIARLFYSFDALQAFTIELSQRVNALSTIVYSNRERIAALERLTDEMDRRIRSLAVRVESLAEYIEDLKKRMSRAEAKILANEIAIRVNSVAIAALIVTVTALSVAVAAIEAELAALSAVVFGLVRTVASLVAQVAALKTLVAALNRRVAAVERDVIEALARAKAAYSLATTALSKANAAYSLATTALARANAAYSLATTALARASAAYSLASTALARASAAYSLATTALARASAAYSLASTALARASAAYSLAIAAKALAEQALQLIQQLITRVSTLEFRVTLIEELLIVIEEKLEQIIMLLEGETDSSIYLPPCKPIEEVDYNVLFSGNGLTGIYSGIGALAASVQAINENTRCKPEGNGNAALPMYYETRPGEVPQLVILWGDLAGGSARWSMSLPHPKNNITETYNFRFPKFTKGNYHFTYRLKDNSQIILNANSKADGMRALNYLTTLVNPSFIDGDQQPKITENAGQRKISNTEVKATFVKKFDGHRDQAARWTKTL